MSHYVIKAASSWHLPEDEICCWQGADIVFVFSWIFNKKLLMIFHQTVPLFLCPHFTSTEGISQKASGHSGFLRAKTAPRFERINHKIFKLV